MYFKMVVKLTAAANFLKLIITTGNRQNKVRFRPVTATKLRITTTSTVKNGAVGKANNLDVLMNETTSYSE